MDVDLSENPSSVPILGEFSGLNETLNVIEHAASYVSDYKSPVYTSASAFKGDSWGLALIHHLRQVVVGLFDRVDDFSNRHTFAKHREVFETIVMFDAALRNTLDRRIESPEYLNQIMAMLTSKSSFGRQLGEFLSVSTIKSIEEVMLLTLDSNG